MFTTPASRGTRPPAAAQTAGPRLRRLAGIVTGLAAFFLAFDAIAPAAHAARTPEGTAASQSGNATDVAFQANTGRLWVVPNGVGQDLGLGMKTGTSPAITSQP